MSQQQQQPVFEDTHPIPVSPAREVRRRRRVSVRRVNRGGNTFRLEGNFLVNQDGVRVQDLTTGAILVEPKEEIIRKVTPGVPLHRRTKRIPGAVYVEDLKKA